MFHRRFACPSGELIQKAAEGFPDKDTLFICVLLYSAGKIWYIFLFFHPDTPFLFCCSSSADLTVTFGLLSAFYFIFSISQIFFSKQRKQKKETDETLHFLCSVRGHADGVQTFKDTQKGRLMTGSSHHMAAFLKG